MTDRTVAITPGSGDQVAFDDNAQQVKLEWGAEGVHTKVADASGKRLPVNLAEINVTVPVSGPLTDAELRATAVPVSGPLTDTQLRASAVPISASALPLPSGAATAAKQPALGTAGSASSDVITVQGVSGMTAVKVDGSAVTQPVSGTVTVQDGGSTISVDDGGSTLSIDDGGGSLTVDGTVAVSGTVTVDSELPTAALLADTANAIPTAPIVGSALMVSNGTTLDLVRTGASDAAASSQKIPAVTFGFNGSTFDRARTVTATMDQAATGIMAAGLVGQLDDVSTQTVTENQFGTVRISSRRALLVEGVASGTNINTNVAQINGATPLMGNGASGTGAQRVTLANDSTGVLATVTTLTNITNWGNVVDNAAFTDGTTRLLMAGHIFDETAGTALTENDAGASRIDSKRAQVMVVEDATTRGQRQAVSAAGAASVNLTQIGGVSVSVGAGAVGTGVQRVTWCSDSPGNLVDNAGFTDGTTGVVVGGFLFDEVAGTALTENDVAAARIDSKRAQVMVLEDGTTRGTRQGVTTDGAAKAVSKFLQVDASTLTRPANTTAYSANDAVSNNATAGSVTAQTAAFSAIADHPVTIDRVRVRSTDTGVAGKAFRVYLFNSDPTASSGVGGGDNAAWSQKLAGFIGSVSGVFRAFSDGSVAIMVPDEGARIIAKPGSGVTTIWLLFQTLEAFTPSANSTTFIATLEGMQGHN